MITPDLRDFFKKAINSYLPRVSKDYNEATSLILLYIKNYKYLNEENKNLQDIEKIICPQ